MSASANIVKQTIAVVASHLKPLIDQEMCQVTRHEDKLMFLMTKGSARICVMVVEHPNIEEESLVEVIGMLAKVDPDKLPASICVSALVLNSRLCGYAVALDPTSGFLCLRGSLIGSTMDELEFSHMLKSLAQSADELDDKFAAALAQAAGAAGSADSSDAVGNLKALAGKLQGVMAEREEALLQAFAESLAEPQRGEFAKMIQDPKLGPAVRSIALGESAAALVALLLTDHMTDEDRRGMAKELLDGIPENELLMQLLAFAVMSIAQMVAKAMEIEPAVLQARVKVAFAQS